jgi:hypothetical protein
MRVEDFDSEHDVTKPAMAAGSTHFGFLTVPKNFPLSILW